MEAHTLKQVLALNPNCQPLYKDGLFEPFGKLEGYFGYYGMLLENYLDRTVQCHVCGEWFGNLAIHIKKHGMNAVEYRSSFGFSKRVPLVHPDIRSLRSEISKDQWTGLGDVERQLKVENLKKGRNSKGNVYTKKATNTESYRNKKNTCEVQLGNRLSEVALHLKSDILSSEAVRNISPEEIPGVKGLVSTIERRFGSWEKGVKFYGYDIPEKTKWEKDDVIKLIKKFYPKNKTIDKWSMLRLKLDGGVPCVATLGRMFGSWVGAIEAAGFDYKRECSFIENNRIRDTDGRFKQEGGDK